MSIASSNIFDDIPAALFEEQFVELLKTPFMKIERIVSTGQTTPVGQFLQEDCAEWVLVLQGSAKLLFEAESEPRLLGSGDYVFIPPRVRHRVDWTDPHRPTIWLAVHFQPSSKT